MASSQTPVWHAAQAGILGQAGATAQSTQDNQFLGTHAQSVIYYPGTSILSPGGAGTETWNTALATLDLNQTFTMSGTTISRVEVPVLPIGNGADLIVSLCADSSGVPGAVITQTRIPAQQILQLSSLVGVSGPLTISPIVNATNNPLAVPQFTRWRAQPQNFGLTWAPPAIGTNILYPQTFAFDTTNGYFFTIGGTDSSHNLTPYVFSYKYVGTTVVNGFNTPNTWGSGTPQASLPVATTSGAACMVDGLLILIGGDSSSATPTSAVYTASWDPTSGQLAAWTQQASFPVTLDSTPNGAATWNNSYVYVVGGATGGATFETTGVYYAQVQNGQITAWNSGPPYPVPVAFPSVYVTENFLVVTGGEGTAGSILTSTYYSEINTATGAPGPWYPGPPSPVRTEASTVSAGNVMVIAGGFTSGGSGTSDLQILTVGATGPGQWVDQTYTGSLPAPGTTAAFLGIFQLSAVEYALFIGTQTSYTPMTISQIPYLSVPLPASGLSNGSTYHIMLQQHNGDLNDYLQLPVEFSPSSSPTFPGNPAYAFSAVNAYSWTSIANNAIPLQIYTNPTARAPGQMPLHTWEDNGARITTTLQATTPDQRILGVCTATQMQLGINQNQGFETGITPWTVTGGTVTRSTAQSFSGLHSALVTPNGSAVQAFISSENLPCIVGQSVTASCWVYAPLGITGTQFSLSINWYSNVGGYISTLSTPTNIPAATWTFVSVTATAPAFAYQWNLNPVEGGTPTTSQVFYIDNILGYWTYAGQQQISVVEYGYSPGTTWPLTSVTELA